jgi:hypothetical protein
MSGNPVLQGGVVNANKTTGESSFDFAVQASLQIGWSMAILANPQASIQSLRKVDEGPPGFHLPTENELEENRRVNLEFERLAALLRSLRSEIVIAYPYFPHDASTLSAAWALKADNPTTPEEVAGAEHKLRQALPEFNYQLLVGLASTNRQLELAYETGRALRDTVNPPLGVVWSTSVTTIPDRFDGWTHQLGRGRVARIQEWLKILNTHFPENSGIVVSTSLGKWSVIGFFLLVPKSGGRIKGGDGGSNNSKTDLTVGLLNQGDVWLGLLTGAESTDGLLTPESYVAAGEASLHRSARIIRRIIFHYWFALALLFAASGEIFYLAKSDLGGAARAWTQIAAIFSSLGITARGVAARIGRLSSAAETPIYEREKLDAMAWSITTLPQVNVSNKKLRAMRRSGIQRSKSLARS